LSGPPALSPIASATPTIVSRTPTVFAAVGRSSPSTVAITTVRRGKDAKMSAARADGTRASP